MDGRDAEVNTQMEMIATIPYQSVHSRWNSLAPRTGSEILIIREHLFYKMNDARTLHERMTGWPKPSAHSSGREIGLVELRVKRLVC